MDSGIAIHLDIQDLGATKGLERLIRMTNDLTPAMKSIGEYMLRRTDQRFTDEKDPEGNPWRPWSAHTLMIQYGWTRKNKDGSTSRKQIYKKRGGLTAGFMRYAQGRKILTASHALRRSITYKATKDSTTVGTNKVYARIHQLGGKAGRNKKAEIPARVYLGMNDADKREALRIIQEFLEA